jgi:hypothetical protein
MDVDFNRPNPLFAEPPFTQARKAIQSVTDEAITCPSCSPADPPGFQCHLPEAQVTVGRAANLRLI